MDFFNNLLEDTGAKAGAGIQEKFTELLDSGLRRNDESAKNPA